MIRALFFASFREALGTHEESLPNSAELETVGALVGHLRARGGIWSSTLAADARIMAAVNQELATMDTRIRDGDEVALFPPVTGG